MPESAPHLIIGPFVGREVIELIFEVAPRKIGSRVGKALDHYAKALRLAGVDDEMGAIRLVAAEEELVVAIFEWLKLNAAAMPEHGDFIGRSKNHRVKRAFYPVLSQFRFVLGDMVTQGITVNGFEDVLHWHVEFAQVQDRIVLPIFDRMGEELITHNPLAVAVSWNDQPCPEVADALFNDFAKIIRDQRGISVREFVTARADYRNKLLYADDAGFLVMDEDLSTLIETVFRTTLRDLLWCLAILLTNTPALKDWGLVSQFIGL
ncbi:MAG TPA: hypothetical protein VGU24_07245 [Microvirga sp.]|jgi:hypothetical protein|nr:hypothetical protein [Microvirga sp.]